MKILLGCWRYGGGTGSEQWIKTVAQMLDCRGHDVGIYDATVQCGSRFKRGFGLVDRVPLPEMRRRDYDIVHCSQTSSGNVLFPMFPRAAKVFQSHGVSDPLDRVRGLSCEADIYLGISAEVLGRMRCDGAPVSRSTVFSHVVDETLFDPGISYRQGQPHALLVSRRVTVAQEVFLRGVLAGEGLGLRWLGGPGHDVLPQRVAEEMLHARLVMTCGRGVVEAALCGRPVVILDAGGLGGYLSADRWGYFQRTNFTSRAGDGGFSLGAIRAAVRSVDHRHGRMLRKLAVVDYGMERQCPRLEDLYAWALGYRDKREEEGSAC